MSAFVCDACAPSVTPLQQLLGRVRHSHRLFAVHWELTYRCNQRCAHCYLDVQPPERAAREAPGAAEQNELSTAECRRVIDEMAALGAFSLVLSGGEPLLRDDWAELAAYARDRYMALRLFTNGTLVDASVASRIAQLHLCTVEVSVYGADARTHDALTRAHGSFDRAIRALRLLREHGVRTVMKTPMMRQNVGQFRGMQALAGELGAQFHHDASITPSANPRLNPLQFRMTEDDLRAYYRQTLEPSRGSLVANVPLAATPDRRPCGIGTSAITIDPYGNVFPCLEVRLAAGNLRQSTLREIWERSGLWAELRRLTLEELPACRACDLAGYCTRCHGLAWQIDGDLRTASSENCRQARIRKEVLEEFNRSVQA